VDVQVYGRRERDIVHRFSPREAMSHAPNPRGPDGSYPERPRPLRSGADKGLCRSYAPRVIIP